MMLDISDDQVLVYAALLHDIGAAADWKRKNIILSMRQTMTRFFHHAENGYQILKDSPQTQAPGLADPPPS